MNYPEPVVRAFILNKIGELLIIGSPNGKGFVAVPGGHIELGEKTIDALVREVKEETGLEIYDIKFLNTDEFINKTDPNKIKHFVFLNYLAKTDFDQVVLNDEDATEYKWIQPSEVINLKLNDSIKKVIQNYF